MKDISIGADEINKIVIHHEVKKRHCPSYHISFNINITGPIIILIMLRKGSDLPKV